ncbi:LA2681 family HEPN domain-containing protein [Chryseobacterium fluminis]|uniref:LA2681 family HEPN domain-containing protein n=1 Tax=Chryseobacterium fluminis TaxID=2983606 RepID=UPI00224CE3E7|nr:LA2681 family HEPN domain-containing protein [Chryseobacterium sp. MMS21-Ot14]UZT98927.1 LA2681 family HEPN domain-containing protein [Chryseobacterium sp. MMS21-Ot14]
MDGILNGTKYEKLRTSFRLCFGILDKIAEGICYIFNLNISKNESIYFENFWNSKRNNKRWEEINQKKNIHLTALYSTACDLEKINGEFGFYKEWRNKLEHGVFSLNDELYLETNWEEPQFSLKTDVKTFEKETLRLLQLTRAAIFSFVFCARTELIKST